MDNTVTLTVNGREFDTAIFDADPNEFEEKKIELDGICSRNGRITEMEYFEDGGDGYVRAVLTTWDGQEETCIFYKGSVEEQLEI